jgi:hypothetical protein
MKKTKLLLLSFLSAISLCAQVENEIDSYIKSRLEIKRDVNMPESVKDFRNHAYLINRLEKYRNDDSGDIRLQTYRLIGDIARNTTDTAHVKQLIEKLVLSQSDSLSYIRGCVDLLQKFSKSQFTPIAINSLYALFLLDNKDKLSRDNILLIGFVGDIGKCDSLYNYAKEKMDNNADEYDVFRQFHSLAWSGKLALARMGDERLTEECIGFMRQYKSNLLLYRFLCKYASYIRTTQSVDFLNELLNVDLRDYPLKPTVKGEHLAMVALEYLQHIIINMPVQPLLTWSDEEVMDRINNARKWMKKNRGKYEINTEIFW